MSLSLNSSRGTRNYEEFFEATETGNERRLRELLASKWDINAVNRQGNTALHRACANSDFNIVRLLVDHGADPNRRGKCGFTCLHMAAQHSENRSLMAYLTRHGADARAKADAGETILHAASTTGNVVGMDFALDCGLDVNTRGTTTSGLASKYLGSDVGAQGFTPLHNLASGCLKMAAFEYLKRRGAHVAALDGAGWNILHVAARSNNLVAIHFGIANGVDLAQKSKAGKTPEDVAREFGASEEVLRNVVAKTDFNKGTDKANRRSQVNDSSLSTYPISVGGCRGIFFIINNKSFADKSLNLAATGRDTGALRRVFQKLGFVTLQKDDLRGEEMARELRGALSRVRRDHDLFVCAMISHGHLGEILGVDGVKVDLKRLISLANSDNVTALRGKPKIFFVEACQGEDDQPMGRNAFDLRSGGADAKVAVARSLASFDHEDFFIGMSCTAGFVSFRDTDRGSSYIQALCRSLQVNTRWEINDVHKEVVAAVVKSARQTPTTRSTLTKRLFFQEPYHTPKAIKDVKNKAGSYEGLDRMEPPPPPSLGGFAGGFFGSVPFKGREFEESTTKPPSRPKSGRAVGGGFGGYDLYRSASTVGIPIIDKELHRKTRRFLRH